MASTIKNLAYIFFILLLLFSCKQEKQFPLEEDKLVSILCDVHIGEAALAKSIGTIKDTTAIILYEQIYAIHGISEAELDSCLALIKNDPILMERIYGKVVKELEKIQSEKK